MISNIALNIFNSLLSIFNIDDLIRYGGLFILCLLVFGSTGLFIGFIIPSGAVVFAAGLYTAAGELHENILTVCTLLIISSILGDMTGYWIGRQAGPALYKRNDSRFFRKQYLVKTEQFYDKYGKIALMVGFFLPIIRTFSPVIAGIVKMDFRRFAISTFMGSILWITSFALAGYIIGEQPFLKPWLKYIVGGFILIVTVPLVIKIVLEIRKTSTASK